MCALFMMSMAIALRARMLILEWDDGRDCAANSLQALSIYMQNICQMMCEKHKQATTPLSTGIDSSIASEIDWMHIDRTNHLLSVASVAIRCVVVPSAD